ncbi:T9SS type A sorting domain-containing protein [Hymenobacter persicinus]|uniref:T9SS type A sorting domain-containing protein n=1 Tax=Hymenobacter persicinus TaxID=2025506 RepID=A0A4Q5LFS9_9BACT|nr:T9SS type A sorting domain-containing protein [Hymenobacter persicinus]RYU79891.1 T9SS type A sorting domain-containing protein [Hymenobacter persicinus]
MRNSTPFRSLLPRLGLAALLGLTAVGAQAQSVPTWARVTRATAPNMNSGSNARRIAVAGDGSYFVVGSFSGTMTLGAVALTSGPGNGHGYVAKLNAAGTVLWAKALESSSGDMNMNVAADAAGNVYVAGYFTNDINLGGSAFTSSGTDSFIVKYNAQGVQQWAKQAGASNAYVLGLAADAAGNVTLAGDSDSNVSFGGGAVTGSGVFVFRFSTTGTVLLGRRISNGGYAEGVALDGAGNTYVTGSFGAQTAFGTINLTSAGELDIFVCKLDAAGTVLWAKRDGSVEYDGGQSIAVDANGNPLVGGYYEDVDLSPTVETSKLYVSRFTSQGVQLWSRQLTSSLPQFFNASGLAYDNRGGYYVTGGMVGTVAFGNTTLASSGQSLFIARYDSQGNVLWADRAANANANNDASIGFGLASDASGNVYLAGAAIGNVTFGSITTADPTPGTVVAKLNAGGIVAAARPAVASLKLSTFPNPAAGQTTLVLPVGGGQLSVFDALGRLVREQALPAVAGNAPVSLAGLAPGLYQLRATLGNGQLATAPLTVR